MALISGFVATNSKIKLHPTETTVKYASAEYDGRLLLQLSSTGSKSKKNPDGITQTYQIDEIRARELWEIIGKTFGFDPT